MEIKDENQKSIEYTRSLFQEYYTTAPAELPDRFGRREFAFILFQGKGMIRHIGFTKKQEYLTFLRERVPQHAYYSSAYYTKPDAATMQEKNWMGAELIFDLDSDHLPNAEKMSYVESLRIVKQEFKKLVEEFLLGDFGFHEKYIELYFSGGRGYHCHVKDPAILDLDSNERRELVDYITGRDIEDTIIFHEQITGRRSYGGRTYISGKSLTMPTPDHHGWKGRISRGIIDIVEEIRKSDNPKQKLTEYGVREKDAEKLVLELSEDRVQRIKDGMLDQTKTIRKFFLNSALRKTAVSLAAGETDEPVTCDVKRLIRLPGSLHGKTGFIVKKIELKKLDDFDPLQDAVVLSDKPVLAHIPTEVTITMNHETFHLSEGNQEIPGFLAVFLIGRKQATILTNS
ncbi:MAG: DNA primase catalytic subunit PriS [Candidatus Thermoplasmatota archaeon]